MSGTASTGVVILAAGNGIRMGIPKLRMRIGDDYFIGKIAATLKEAGLDEVVCVIRDGEKEWIAEHFRELSAVVNPAPDRGMISSVQIGIRYYSSKEAVFLIPVDHPMVRPATYRMLLDGFMTNRSAVIIPSYNRQAGHPVLIPRSLFSDINHAGADDRLSDLLRKSGKTITYLECQDVGVLRNINTPEDLSLSGEAPAI